MAEFVLDLFTLFGPLPPRGAEPGVAPLQALLTKHGVAGGVTLSTRALYHNAHAGNRETQALCAEAGGTLLPAALIDPRLVDPLITIGNARLLCFFPATQHWPLPFAPFADLITEIAARPTPVWIEAARLGDATRIAEALKGANRTQSVILGGVTGATLSEAVSVARRNPNLMLATNGLQGVGEIALAVKTLGEERIVFASGVPHRALGATLALHRHAGLTPEQENLVMGGITKKLMASSNSAGGAA